MRIIEFSGNRAKLLTEVSRIPLERIPDGSGSSHLDGPEGWIKGLSMTRLSMSSRLLYPMVWSAIDSLIEEFEPKRLVQIMVNKLDSGGELSPHRDGLPSHARFHLPVLTHPDVYWWDELEGKQHMQTGYWYGPVPYCGIMHSAGNPSPIDRLHIVIDLQ